MFHDFFQISFSSGQKQNHFFFLHCTYFVDNQHWVDLGTSRGIWPHTLYSACPGERCPTAAPRTRSSKWAWWPSTPRSCVGWCRRWDIWGPGGSFCRRDSSARTQTRDREGQQCATIRFILAEGQMYLSRSGINIVNEDWPVLRYEGCWTSGPTWCLPSWSSEPRTEWQERGGVSVFQLLPQYQVLSKQISCLWGKVYYYCLSGNIPLNSYSILEVPTAVFKVLPLIRVINLLARREDY